MRRFNHGSMEAFIKYRREEFVAVLDNVVDFTYSHANEIEPRMSQRHLEQIESDFGVLRTHLMDQTNDYFGSHKPVVFGHGQDMFEAFHDLLGNELVPLHRKMDAIGTLAPHMTMCSGAIMTAMQAGVSSLTHGIGGLRGATQLKKIELIEATILDHVQQVHDYRSGNEVHFVNAYYNVVAEKLGVPERNDLFSGIAHPEISNEHFGVCLQAVTAKLQPLDIARAIAEDYLGRMRLAVEAAGVDTDNPVSDEALKALFSVTDKLKLEVLDQEFGPVPHHCYLITPANTGGMAYELAQTSTLIAKHFIENLQCDLLVDYNDVIAFPKDKLGDEKIKILGDLIWLDQAGHATQITLQDLLAVSPREMVCALQNQAFVSTADYAGILKNVVHNVVNAAGPLPGEIPEYWLVDFVASYKAALPPELQDLQSLVMLAAQYGSADLMQALLRQDASADAQDPEKRLTAAMLAVERNHVDVLRCLIKNHVNLEARGQNDATAMMHAVRFEKLAALQCLIDAHADVNAAASGDVTATIIASITSNVDVIQCLITARADINAADASGWTPVMYAAKCRNIDGLKCLINGQANVDLKNVIGRTAATIAAHYCNVAALQCLIDAQADINIADNLGYTPVMIAASIGDANTLRCLMGSNADINFVTHDGCTAAILAAESSHVNVLQSLIDGHADLDNKPTSGYTAVMRAAWRDDIDVLQCLIKGKADVEARDLNGNTAVIIAAREGRVAALQCLIDAGADINAVNLAGHTPVIAAILQQQIQTLGCLLTNQADPGPCNAKDLADIRLITQGDFPQSTRIMLQNLNRRLRLSP